MRDGLGQDRVGCLLIEALDSAPCGARDRARDREADGLLFVRFCPGDGRDLWERLQTGLQELRVNSERLAVAGVGEGCCGALALAEQLPVDRLVLIDPVLSAPDGDRRRSEVDGLAAPRHRGDAARQIGRLAAFARRNLSLCVSDVLLVGHSHRPDRLARMLPHCRVTCLLSPPQTGEKRLINCENAEKQAITRFLKTGELPKSLAENPEMCIIYG